MENYNDLYGVYPSREEYYDYKQEFYQNEVREFERTKAVYED
jgi:hypothetical protein